MKNIFTLFALAITLCFVCCQKQFTISDLTPSPIDSNKTVVDSSIRAGVLSVAVNGTYKKDSILGAGNTLTVNIKVAKPGTYKIFTDTTAGFSFSKSVTYTDTGYKSITVPGTGKPTVAGSVPFVLRFDTSKYAFVIAVLDTTPTSVSIPLTGKIGYQQELFAVIGTLREGMVYDQNGLIKEIRSQHYPNRKIFYNSNNKISKIEYWYLNGNGTSYERDRVNAFEYDANGNVTRLADIDTVTNTARYSVQEFEYNADNTMKSRKDFDYGRVSTSISYSYTNGNLTTLIEGHDTAQVTYDTRTNNFKNISPQFYFLDIQNTFEQTFRGEIFFFSKNYPTNIGGLPVVVSTTTDGSKPFEIKFGNNVWYRYGYN